MRPGVSSADCLSWNRLSTTVGRSEGTLSRPTVSSWTWQLNLAPLRPQSLSQSRAAAVDRSLRTAPPLHRLAKSPASARLSISHRSQRWTSRESPTPSTVTVTVVVSQSDLVSAFGSQSIHRWGGPLRSGYDWTSRVLSLQKPFDFPVPYICEARVWWSGSRSPPSHQKNWQGSYQAVLLDLRMTQLSP